MTETLLAAGVLVASLSVTYFCCLRPMRRDPCCRSTDTNEMRRLRREVASLRRQAARGLRREADRAVVHRGGRHGRSDRNRHGQHDQHRGSQEHDR